MKQILGMNRQTRRKNEPRYRWIGSQFPISKTWIAELFVTLQTHNNSLPISQRSGSLEAEDQDVPAPYIHPFLEVGRDWTLTICTWLRIISKWVLSGLSVIFLTRLAQRTIRFLWAGMIILLACVFARGYCQQLIDNHLRP